MKEGVAMMIHTFYIAVKLPSIVFNRPLTPARANQPLMALQTQKFVTAFNEAEISFKAQIRIIN